MPNAPASGQVWSLPANADLLPKSSHDIAAGLVAALDVLQCLFLDGRIDREEFSAFARVCIDETKGRQTALAVGLKVTGALGLLARAKTLGLISELRVHPGAGEPGGADRAGGAGRVTPSRRGRSSDSLRSSDLLTTVALHPMSSPSLMHEGVIALVRDNPAFAASLLRDLLHIEVPRFDEARLTEAALHQLVPVEYHADAVVLFVDFLDHKKQPVFGTIFEVQLERKDRKRYTWPLYAVAARARYECPFVLTVVTPDPAVARWAGQPIELGNGIFVPRVIGPEGIPQVTDRDRAAREPQLAVLSVVAHGGGEVATAVSIARAAVDAVLSLPEEQRLLYSVLIERALSEAARKALDMESQIEKFFTEAHRRSYEQGKAKGEAKALMVILKRRGLALTDEQQHQIATCTDLATLDRWLERAFSVTSVDELLA